MTARAAMAMLGHSWLTYERTGRGPYLEMNPEKIGAVPELLVQPRPHSLLPRPRGASALAPSSPEL